MPAKAKSAKQPAAKPAAQRKAPKRQTYRPPGRQQARAHIRQMAPRSSNAGRVAHSISLPGEYSQLRLPTASAPRTSVCSLKDQVTLTCANASATNTFAAGTMSMAYFGQPARLAMVTTALTTGNYDLIFGVGASASDSWNLVPTALNSSVTTYSIDAEWPLLNALARVGTTPPHGGALPVGRGVSGAYIFMNIGDTITNFTTTWTSSMVGNYTWHIYRFLDVGVNPGVYAFKTAALTAGQIASTAIFTATVPGYYKLKFAEFELSSGAMSSTGNIIKLALNCNATVGWRHISMADLDQTTSGDANLGVSCRPSAASVLITNTTAAINRQGTVLAARIRAIPFTEMTPAALAGRGEKYTGDACNGCYSFKEFTQYGEKFREVTTPYSYSFDIDYDDHYHFITISCPSVATMANTYTVSFDTILEFITDVGRYPKATSSFTFDDLFEARRLLNSNPHWFYENPTHMARIYNFVRDGIKGVGKFAQRIAPYAATAASAIDPPGAPGYAALSRMFRAVHIS